MGTLNEPETDFQPQSTEQESPSRLIAKSFPGAPRAMAHRSGHVRPKGSALFFWLRAHSACLLWKDPETTSQNTNIPQARFPSLRAIERTNVSKYSAGHTEIKCENAVC